MHPGKPLSRNWIIDESKFLKLREIKRLRNTANKLKIEGLEKNKFTPVRNWFMVELGFNSGMRVEEMASLKHRNLLIDETRSSIKVIGKGNKKRPVWISTQFKRTCLQYLNYKKKFGFKMGSEAYLLNNLMDRKITKRSLQKFFKIMARKAMLSGHYSIHCFRHTYVTYLLIASNHNYRFVQKQVGHASIRTTQVYAGVIEKIGRKAIEKMYK